ncbi:hypothetical protein A7J50_3784 [Pseudomonas antarctica]|uniref:Uncharacterized protein n=2 Tax=Pseudomonas antarctica TaxID=219572 RepID=A0A172Z3T9_9PSED|nr:hypothetical protein A7J50_3784 [Pseudomonas antarctica]
MKRMSAYLGLALAACLSCFSLSAFAGPIADRAAHYLTALNEPQGVAMQRLELTLAMWRTGSQTTDESLASNLRASSNHFVMASAKPAPDGVGLTPC